MRAAYADGFKPLRLGRGNAGPNLKTSALEAVSIMHQSRASCKVVNGVPHGLVLQCFTPLDEVLAGDDLGTGVGHRPNGVKEELRFWDF